MKKDFLIKAILDPEITSESFNTQEFDKLLKHAEKHRIKQIFLDKTTSKNDPREKYQELKKIYTRYSVARDLKIFEEINNLKSIFKTIDLQFIFLKGSAFKKTLYEKPYHRDCRDIDILVHESDVPKTLESLFSCGYKYLVSPESNNISIDFENTHQIPVLVSPNGQFVEIHFRITMENSECRLSKDMLKSHDNNVASKFLNFFHVTYHALAMNRLNNGLMSLIDIHYLLENEDKSQLLEQSKQYNLEKLCEHMIMLYEINKSMDSSNSKVSTLLRNSNSLIHAGEKLVPFKTNIFNLKHALEGFYKKYIGENKKSYTKRVSYWNLLNYVFQKFYYHIKSVVFNPLLWLKRNKLKEFLKNN